MRATLIPLCSLLLFATVADARAGGPLEALKDRIDRTIKVLDDPALKGDARLAQRRVAVRQIQDEVFDFEEMARRALGQHWQGRSPGERKRFVGLFADLLERAYFWRLDAYTGEAVRYVGEAIDADLATVQTVIVTKGGANVPIDYRMLRRDSGWFVYDILIEGVSLVANYRSQFNKVIRTESFDALVKRMEAKIEKPES